jgi:alpha,alpha-trehalose phosphorylase
VLHHGERITLTPEPQRFTIPKIDAGEPPKQPPGRAPMRRDSEKVRQYAEPSNPITEEGR